VRGRSAEAYRDELLALQPPGLALPAEPDSTWAQLLLALAGEWARVDGRAATLVDEANPRTTLELLPEWEAEFGLPDACSLLAPQTIENRRAAVVQRATSNGGQSRAYFVGVAERLGFPGAEVIEYERHSVDADVDEPLYGEAAAYAWTLRAPLPPIDQMTVDSDVDAALGEKAQTARLECTIRRLAPAHTTVHFDYT